MNLRRALLPSAIVLALSLSFAVAQNINKAIQLSQDASGAFGVDSNNYVYFPGHILSTGPGVPTLSCGGTAATILGTDTSGEITTGTTSSNNCVVTFAKAYLATPWCVVTAQQNTTPITSYTEGTANLQINFATDNTAKKLNYWCSGSK